MGLFSISEDENILKKDGDVGFTINLLTATDLATKKKWLELGLGSLLSG